MGALQNELASTKQEVVACTENLEMLKIEEKNSRDQLEMFRLEAQEMKRENEQQSKKLENVSLLEKEKQDGGQSHRTTDDEIVGGELGTELRRERGRVERLRGELITVEKRENQKLKMVTENNQGII